MVDAKAKWWVAEANGMGRTHVVDVEAKGGGTWWLGGWRQVVGGKREW